MTARPKPAPDGSRADLGDLLTYALDVRRCTRTPDGEVVERLRDESGAVTERVIACLHPDGVDTGGTHIREALALRYGDWPDRVDLLVSDRGERSLSYRSKDRVARVRDDGWCYGLLGFSRLLTAGRPSADVLALMTGRTA